MSHLSSEYQAVGRFAREIVAKRLAITAGVTEVASVLAAQHVVPTGLSDGAVKCATVGLNVLGVVVGVLWARKDTTPADPVLLPKTASGAALVPVQTADPGGDMPAPVYAPDDPALPAA